MPEIANCIVIDGTEGQSSSFITGGCNKGYVILAHEFGHILFDNLGHEQVTLLGQSMRQNVNWVFDRGSFDHAPKRIADTDSLYDVNKFIPQGSDEVIIEGQQGQLGMVKCDMNPVDMTNASIIRKTPR